AAEGADAVFSMVGDDAASRAMWLGDDGVLAAATHPGALAIECSTLSYDWVGELAGSAADRGMGYIDAPVTGLPDAAAAGDLVLLVGAAADDLEAARPLLEPLSSKIFHFGPVGAGTAYKLMINLMGAVQIAAAAEGLLIAEKAGLDLEQVREAIEIGQAASPQVVRNVRRMVADHHDTDIVFSGRLRLKDAQYGLQLAQQMGVDAAFGQAAVDIYWALVDRGFGEANESKVLDGLRQG
ncbi:MAG: NAD(P)-dependent oxidoreductase, partial [Hyphomicrobiales bacterium]